jgi:hypothetical protein
MPSSPVFQKKRPSQREGRTKSDVVDLVEEPFVVEELVEDAELADEAAGQARIADIGLERDQEADDHHGGGRELHPKRRVVDFLHQMRVEEKAAAPEMRSFLGAMNGWWKAMPANTAPSESTRKRHQHRPRAFVRMIAAVPVGTWCACASSGRVSWPAWSSGCGSWLVIMRAAMIVRIVQRVLDMLGGRPARLAEEGQEHEPPAVEAGQQGREEADREGEAAGRRRSYRRSR